MKFTIERTIKIILVDDHPLFREGVKRILEMEPNFEVVAEGDDGKEVVDLVQQYLPDVVLLDINMPEVNGVEATRQLMQKVPGTKVIIFVDPRR